MSSFVVSNKTINIIVGAIKSAKYRQPYPRKLPELRYIDKYGDFLDGASDNPPKLGEELVILNLAAFGDRYPDKSQTLSSEAEKIYRYEDLSYDLPSAYAIHKAFSCFLYQCTEGKIPDNPLFIAIRAFMLELANITVSHSPEWESSPWDS